MALIAFLMCFGGFIQNAEQPADAPLEEHHRRRQVHGQPLQERRDAEIFGWNPASNNNYLYSGTGSMILNAISATRTPEAQNLPFADDLWIWPIPTGPHGRLGLEHVMGCYSIWKFAQNKANAQQFLADLCINYKQATLASQLYNFPSFPGAFPFDQIRKVAAADTHKPKGKYSILTTIAEKYTHNIGYPGNDERGDRRDLLEVPDPADVRAGLAGEAERRGVGAGHDEHRQGHLRQMEEAREDLTTGDRRPDQLTTLPPYDARAMRAAIVSGGRLRVEERPDPAPLDRELLISVRAAGINGADLAQRAGGYPPPPGAPPDVPGLECAGEVAAMGTNVFDFRVGDRVMALLGGGGHAELTTVHERHALPVPTPSRTSRQAASWRSSRRRTTRCSPRRGSRPASGCS